MTWQQLGSSALAPQQRQLSWSPVRASPKPFWIVMTSPLPDGNPSLTPKQPVPLSTGTIPVLSDIFSLTVCRISKPIQWLLICQYLWDRTSAKVLKDHLPWLSLTKMGPPALKWNESSVFSSQEDNLLFFCQPACWGKAGSSPEPSVLAPYPFSPPKKTPGELLSNWWSAHHSTSQVTPDDRRVNSQMESSNEQSGNSLVGKRSRNLSQAEHNERSLLWFVCYSIRLPWKLRSTLIFQLLKCSKCPCKACLCWMCVLALAVPPSLLWLSKPVAWQLAKESSWPRARRRPAKLSLKSCRWEGVSYTRSALHHLRASQILLTPCKRDWAVTHQTF